jgi:methylated-DNA-[protein]-cysteine S-methyltransferase
LTKQVPRGKITTYKILAKKAGHPSAFRACGNVLNKNEFLGKVPCHRVVRSDGFIGGYVKGVDEKEKILLEEGVRIKERKIVDFDLKLWS